MHIHPSSLHFASEVPKNGEKEVIFPAYEECIFVAGLYEQRITIVYLGECHENIQSTPQKRPEHTSAQNQKKKYSLHIENAL